MNFPLLVWGLITMTGLAAGAEEEGLVARYSIDEPSGNIARDTSGHGFEGNIRRRAGPFPP